MPISEVRKAYENVKKAVDELVIAVERTEYFMAGLSLLKRDLRFVESLVRGVETAGYDKRRDDGISKEYANQDQNYQCGQPEGDGINHRDAESGEDEVSGRIGISISGTARDFLDRLSRRGGDIDVI